MSSQTSRLTYLTSGLSGKARAVEEFALHLLYRELEFLPSGRRFRLLKGKSNRVRNSFIEGHQLVLLCLIYSFRVFCSVDDDDDALNFCLSVFLYFVLLYIYVLHLKLC